MGYVIKIETARNINNIVSEIYKKKVEQLRATQKFIKKFKQHYTLSLTKTQFMKPHIRMYVSEKHCSILPITTVATPRFFTAIKVLGSRVSTPTYNIITLL